MLVKHFKELKRNVFTSGNNCKITDNNGKDEYLGIRSEGDESPYQIEHNKLFQSIRSGGVINNAEYGAKSTLTAIMGRMATYTGKEITWEQALNSTDFLCTRKLMWNSTPPVYRSERKVSIPVPGVTKTTLNEDSIYGTYLSFDFQLSVKTRYSRRDY